MKLIYIYGPPAVGKLTVTKELAKLTNFKIFHAHLTADYVSSVFPVRDKKSNDLKWHFAFKMFEEAVKNNIDLIFTNTYDESDNFFIKKVMGLLKKYNSEVLFVKLSCNPNALYERVVKPSRKSFGKMKTVDEMRKSFKKDWFKTIPFKKSLIIDNTNIPPKECAKNIKDYYKL